MNTLDDIIKACEKKYNLKVDEKNRNFYLNFLKRQLKKHPEYDLNKKFYEPSRLGSVAEPYMLFNLMVDKLMLFSYLTGRTQIIAGYVDKTGDHTKRKRIRSVKDLYLLRPTEIGTSASSNQSRHEAARKKEINSTDRRLKGLLARINNWAYKYRGIYRSWGYLIDELGQDKEVIKNFGQIITHEIVLTCPSPNPYVFGHGGYRWGKRKH